MDYTPLTRAQIQDMTQLEYLIHLRLHGVLLEDGGLSRLASLASLQNLELLDIAGLTDDDLADVAILVGLEHLWVSGTPQITGATLDRLPAGLLGLWLEGTGVTDEGLAGLRHLTRLEKLVLNNNTAITDAGLIHLQPLNALRFLWIPSAAVTDAGVAELKRHLPNVLIQR